MFKITRFLVTAAVFTSCAYADRQTDGLLSQLQIQYDQQQRELSYMRGQIEQLKNQISHIQSSPIKTQNIQSEKRTPTSTDDEEVSASSTHPEYEEAQQLLGQRRFAEAASSLTLFIKKYPSDPLSINAYYWLGETYYIRGDYSQAALEFGEAYQTYQRFKKKTPTSPFYNKAPEIMLKLAMSLSNIGKMAQAELVVTELEKEFSSVPGNLRHQLALLKRELSRRTV